MLIIINWAYLQSLVKDKLLFPNLKGIDLRSIIKYMRSLTTQPVRIAPRKLTQFVGLYKMTLIIFKI